MPTVTKSYRIEPKVDHALITLKVKRRAKNVGEVIQYLMERDKALSKIEREAKKAANEEYCGCIMCLARAAREREARG